MNYQDSKKNFCVYIQYDQDKKGMTRFKAAKNEAENNAKNRIKGRYKVELFR